MKYLKKHINIWYIITLKYYNDDGFIRPLCIKHTQIIDYVKHFDSSKIMYLKVIDNKLLKQYAKIWERVSSLMNIKSYSKPVYGDMINR